tara:strand:+ start:415 stop:897 length:483 start_codon:yes stop_codon:yes gene_type:complete
MNNPISSIYKIQDRKTKETYYGCTGEKIARRMSKHKTRPTCSCRDIIKRGDYDVEVLEEYITTEISKRFLLERERHYIVNFDCVNIMTPLQTRKEYYQKNREARIAYGKEWKRKRKIKLFIEKRKSLLNNFIYIHLNKINQNKDKNSIPSFSNFVTIIYR